MTSILWSLLAKVLLLTAAEYIAYRLIVLALPDKYKFLSVFVLLGLLILFGRLWRWQKERERNI